MASAAVTLVLMFSSPRGFTMSRRVAIGALAVLLLTSCADSSGSDADDPDSTEGTGQAEHELTDEQIAEQERAEQEAHVQELVEEHDAALAGPSEEHREDAAQLVAEMTLDQQAGQVLIGEYVGTDAESAAEQVEQLHLAGMILMGHNIPGEAGSVDTEALSSQIATISEAGETERAVPPIISVDQEGGLVTRVGSPLTEWPTPMAYGAADAAESAEVPQLALHGHRHMAVELADLGFTVSFAPSADVTFGAADPTIGSRSFGGDTQQVAELALGGIRGLAEGGVAGSVKHFPGHGSVTEDSHSTLPVQEQSLDQLRERDWAPFAEAIAAGVPMVMMGHIEVPALDPQVPSSLSEAAYEEIRQMGYEGVIVTDAMNMAAIANTYGGDQAVVQALGAGADLVLMPASAAGAHSAIVSAVETDELSEQRLAEAAERVVALVLWQQELAAGELAAGPGIELPEEVIAEITGGEPEYWDQDAEGIAVEAARQSLTLVEGQCGAETVSEAIQIAGGTEQDRARLATAAQDAGLQVGWGPIVTLLGGTTPGSGDIAVALDRPEGLADSVAETKIALYGRTPESFSALIEVLTGAEAPGALPVQVGEYAIGDSAC